MPITPKCDPCGKELQAPGGLAFSPPKSVEAHAPVEKYHVCAECWKTFVSWAQRKNVTPGSALPADPGTKRTEGGVPAGASADAEELAYALKDAEKDAEALVKLSTGLHQRIEGRHDWVVPSNTQTALNFIDYLKRQNKSMKKALEEIRTNEGPGLDGSSENASGRIARLVLEGLESGNLTPDRNWADTRRPGEEA